MIGDIITPAQRLSQLSQNRWEHRWALCFIAAACILGLMMTIGCENERCDMSAEMREWGESLCAEHGGLVRFRGGGKTSHKAQCSDGKWVRISSREFHSKERYICRKIPG